MKLLSLATALGVAAHHLHQGILRAETPLPFPSATPPLLEQTILPLALLQLFFTALIDFNLPRLRILPLATQVALCLCYIVSTWESYVYNTTPSSAPMLALLTLSTALSFWLHQHRRHNP